MPNKKRYQNPVIGDTVELQLFVYNANAPADLLQIYSVDIYGVNPNGDPNNPLDRFLVQTIDGSNVRQIETGIYQVDVLLEAPQYQIGTFVDVWKSEVVAGEGAVEITNIFEVYPDLWYSFTQPAVYDFAFTFRPNRMRKGSKQYLILAITPNVPTGSDLKRYYENLAIAGNALMTMTRISGPCLPAEPLLRIAYEDRPPDYKELLQSFYKIDTSELEVGMYNVFFSLPLGDNLFVSDNMAFQIYD